MNQIQQDDPHSVLWLTTGADKMVLSCPLGLPAVSRKKSLTDEAYTVTMAGNSGLDRSYRPRFRFYTWSL